VAPPALQASTVVSLALLGVLLAYGRGFLLLSSQKPDAVSRWRLLAFLSGVGFLWLSVASPLAGLDHQRLVFHMLQHLLEMNVAAPLLLLGAPVRVLASALPGPGSVDGQVSPTWPGALGRGLTHPAVCWLLGTTVVIGWHVPLVLEHTLHSPIWHGLQHGSFLLAGLLFWWPVVLPWPAVPRWPRWALPLYLFLATLPCDALSAFLAFSGRVIYPHYLVQAHGSAASPLADQAAAGALMWLFVTVAYLFPAVLITLQLLSRTRGPLAPGRGAGASEGESARIAPSWR
jgi:putative membrane protein